MPISPPDRGQPGDDRNAPVDVVRPERASDRARRTRRQGDAKGTSDDGMGVPRAQQRTASSGGPLGPSGSSIGEARLTVVAAKHRAKIICDFFIMIKQSKLSFIRKIVA